jgi:hypothetical protein
MPTEHGGISAEITVVHFVKHGSSSKETSVSVIRDGRLYISNDIRKTLRYDSDGEMFQAVVPSWEKVRPILEFVRSAEFKAQGASSRSNLPQRWSSDSWYVYGERVPFRIFSSANHSVPPKEVVDWFNDMNALPKSEGCHFATRDVCLGFCYGP